MIRYIRTYLDWIIWTLHRWWPTRKYVDIMLQDTDINELAKWTSIATFFKAISLPLGLATSLIISRWYGADSMGLYSLIVTISGLAVSIWLVGIGAAMPRLLWEARAKKTKTEMSIYRTSTRIIFFSGIIISVLLYFSAWWLSYSIFDEPRLLFALQMTSLFIFPMMRYRLNSQFLLASKKVWYNELITKGIVPVAMLMIVLVSYWLWPTYYIPIWAYLLTNAWGMIISLYILWKYKFVALRWKLEPLQSILTISSPMLVTGMVWTIAQKTDIFMLGWLWNTNNVGIYQVIFSIVSLLPIWLELFWSIVKPKIAELFWWEKQQELQKIIRVSSLGISIIALCWFILLQFFPHIILGLRGAEFVDWAMTLRILSIGFLVHAFCGNNGLYMNGTGKQLLLQKIILLTALINIILNYILIPLYGIEGAAIASMVSIIVQNIVISWYIWKIDKIKTFIRFGK